MSGNCDGKVISLSYETGLDDEEFVGMSEERVYCKMTRPLTAGDDLL